MMSPPLKRSLKVNAAVHNCPHLASSLTRVDFVDHEYEQSDHNYAYENYEEPAGEETKPKTPAQIAEEHGVSLVLQRDKQQKWLVKPVHVSRLSASGYI